MTDEYIDSNFLVIKKHASDIENRLDDAYLNSEWLKEENQKYIRGFEETGEEVVLIGDDYISVIDKLSH